MGRSVAGRTLGSYKWEQKFDLEITQQEEVYRDGKIAKFEYPPAKAWLSLGAEVRARSPHFACLLPKGLFIDLDFDSRL